MDSKGGSKDQASQPPTLRKSHTTLNLAWLRRGGASGYCWTDQNIQSFLISRWQEWLLVSIALPQTRFLIGPSARPLPFRFWRNKHLLRLLIEHHWLMKIMLDYIFGLANLIQCATRKSMTFDWLSFELLMDHLYRSLTPLGTYKYR